MRLSRVSEKCYWSLRLVRELEQGVNQIVHQVERPSCPAARDGVRVNAFGPCGRNFQFFTFFVATLRDQVPEPKFVESRCDAVV
jgi:hypothetical protein